MIRSVTSRRSVGNVARSIRVRRIRYASSSSRLPSSGRSGLSGQVTMSPIPCRCPNTAIAPADRLAAGESRNQLARLLFVRLLFVRLPAWHSGESQAAASAEVGALQDAAPAAGPADTLAGQLCACKWCTDCPDEPFGRRQPGRFAASWPAAAATSHSEQPLFDATGRLRWPVANRIRLYMYEACRQAVNRQVLCANGSIYVRWESFPGTCDRGGWIHRAPNGTGDARGRRRGDVGRLARLP